MDLKERWEVYVKLRDERGLTDSDVARDSGVTKSTFSDWKSGRCAPKVEKLRKIAVLFEVPVDYLLTGEMPGLPERDGELLNAILSDTQMMAALRKYMTLQAREKEKICAVLEALVE